ncbi:hypothetical protein KKH27_10350, partial [bacterium]|nr:hypothetical protein [bacterium]
DRFDFLLLSYNFPNPGGWDYIAGSYNEFGNDGNHFNDSINAPPNLAVPDSIANSLHAASDHLPVYLDVRRIVGGAPSIAVVSPNGSESWNAGSPRDITWTSQYVTGTVSIRLNRSYPTGAWETVIGGTANDGTHSWTVTGPATTAARIRILSDSDTTVADVSDANFSITQTAVLTLLAPNGGELWNIGQSGTIQWNGSGFSGNVRIELNRTYPSGSWTVLYGSAINDGNELWPVSAPPTTQARIRIFSLSVPTAGDTSDANFVIRYSAPPSVTHDPHGDGEPGNVVVTARITDDFAGVTGKLFYRLADATGYDSIAMSTTGYPNEFAASVSLSSGRWVYFIRALDSHSQIASTDTFGFVIGPSCGQSLAYDDGSAEQFNWSTPDSFLWAVRFTPPEVPFVLCGASFAVAAFHPDSSHSRVRIQVLAADGPLGMPGTVLREVVRGSVGNMIGGFPAPGAYFANVVLFDDITEPLEFAGDFYIAVGNLDGKAEAFALDTSSTNTGRSAVFDPCEESWLPEDGVHESSRDGNRMIRIHGWSGSPDNVVIWRSGDELRLTWSLTGSPFYRVYKSLSAQFDLFEFVGATSNSSLVVGAVSGGELRAYYRVASSSSP